MRAAWRSSSSTSTHVSDLVTPVCEQAPWHPPVEVREHLVTLPSKSADDQSGLCLSSVDGLTLRIVSVDNDGAIGNWNRENPTSRVKKGDRIVEINGIRNDARAMLQEMKYSEKCHLRVRCTADLEHHCRMLQFRTLGPEDFELLGMLDEVNPQKSQGMPESCVTSLPCIQASSCQATKCGICLEDFLHTTLVTQLPCDHTFCEPCIKTWITQYKNRCPVCQLSLGTHRSSVVSTCTTIAEDSSEQSEALSCCLDEDDEAWMTALDVNMEFDASSKSVIQMPLRALDIHGATHCQGLSTRRGRPRGVSIVL